MNDIAVIHLTNGGVAIVDADLYESLNGHRWQRKPDGGVYRSAIVDGKQRTVFMHRAVNQTPAGACTDHINGFRCDNRRSNLRAANKSTNAANSTPAKRIPNSKFGSRFKGVYHNPGRPKSWVVRIGCRNTLKHIGSFSTEREAAMAYNAAAKARYGAFAKLNTIAKEVDFGL